MGIKRWGINQKESLRLIRYSMGYQTRVLSANLLIKIVPIYAIALVSKTTPCGSKLGSRKKAASLAPLWQPNPSRRLCCAQDLQGRHPIQRLPLQHAWPQSNVNLVLELSCIKIIYGCCSEPSKIWYNSPKVRIHSPRRSSFCNTSSWLWSSWTPQPYDLSFLSVLFRNKFRWA